MRLLTEEEKKMYPHVAADSLIYKYLLLHDAGRHFESEMLLSKNNIEIHFFDHGEKRVLKTSYATEQFALEVFDTIRSIGNFSLTFLTAALGFKAAA